MNKNSNIIENKLEEVLFSQRETLIASGITNEEIEEVFSKVGETIILDTISSIVESIPEGEDRESIVSAINEGQEDIFDALIEKYNIDVNEIIDYNAKAIIKFAFNVV